MTELHQFEPVYTPGSTKERSPIAWRLRVSGGWIYEIFSAGRANAVFVPDKSFQSRVQEWMKACFTDEIAASRQERNHRFLEEALELVQANDCTASEAHQLVDYVFGRHIGEREQEVGGTLVCLAALCSAIGIDMDQAAEDELARVWKMIDKIRVKHAAKPKHSPLPGA